MTINNNTRLKNAYLVAGSLVLAIILAEIVLRIVLPPPVIWKLPQESYDFDAEIGHWLNPGQHAYTHDKPVSINSAGIRDREYEPRPAAGVTRILALGDSQTFGNGLVLEDTWPKQLESELNGAGGESRFEVLNAGLPASDTWQHEIIMRRMMEKYHPDAVVLAFYVNDVVQRHAPNPAWHRENNRQRSRLVYMLRQSVLLLTLHQAYSAVRQMLDPSPAILRQEALLSGEEDEEFRERWNQVGHSIFLMKEMADRNNITFMIASLPRRDQVYGRISWHGYNRNLENIAARYGIPLVSMLEPLQQEYGEYGSRLFIPWDGHNSALANRIIAREIAAVLTGPADSDTRAGAGPETVPH